MTEDCKKVLELTTNIEDKDFEGYSATALDHGIHPRNMGDLNEYNAFDILTGPCGHTIGIWLNVKDGIIDGICFNTDGSMDSRAAGSMTTELAKGKTLDQAKKISQQDVLDALGGLPEANQYCALLASDTLKKAIDSYRQYLQLERECLVGIEPVTG